jgi:hypothetical protein
MRKSVTEAASSSASFGWSPAGVLFRESIELQGPDGLRIGEPTGQPGLLELGARIPEFRPLLCQLVVDGLFLGRPVGVMTVAAGLGLENALAGGRIGRTG